jgi:gamma-glutamyltranspeptidase/glutathione hydrolase
MSPVVRIVAAAFTLAMAGTVDPGPARAQQAADAVSPEGAVRSDEAIFGPLAPDTRAALAARAEGAPVRGEDWMIAAAHPLAAQAGARILAEGGSAADAMIAAQAVLGLVEPQSSGLGGGAFLLWWDPDAGGLTTLDGRETAPMAATPRLFQDEGGQPLPFFDAVVGGRSVGAPGTPRLMAEAHARWGRADWADLFADAIALAENGFTVSPRLSALIAADAERLSRFPDTAAYFLPGGRAPQPGDILCNPAYAETLRILAQRGADAFYDGPVAADIVAAVQGAPGAPGLLTETDLAIYRVKERAPVCAAYRDHQVCGMGPPSSGGVAVGQILGMLADFDLSALGPDDPEAWRLIGDASRLAFADRGRYLADSDFVPVPLRGLLDPAYLSARAALLAPGADGARALETVAPGEPAWDHAMLWADDRSPELPSTSHLSIVDAHGAALSMTTTIENGFGSRLFVRGFLLNNQLTDFSFSSHEDGRPVANRVEPGKRPRSSMAPTIVLRDGAPVLVVGAPGGSRIIGFVAQALIAAIDWGMDPQQAVAQPRVVNRFGPMEIEPGPAAEALDAPLAAMGFETQVRPMDSGLHLIAIGEDGLTGGADPRREGVALGR